MVRKISYTHFEILYSQMPVGGFDYSIDNAMSPEIGTHHFVFVVQCNFLQLYVWTVKAQRDFRNVNSATNKQMQFVDSDIKWYSNSFIW